MGYCNINMIDAEDGTFSVKVVFSNDEAMSDPRSSFNPASHAHQHGKLLLEYLDRLAKRLEEPVVTAPVLAFEDVERAGEDWGIHV